MRLWNTAGTHCEALGSFNHADTIIVARGLTKPEPIAVAEGVLFATPGHLCTPGDQMEPSELGERGVEGKVCCGLYLDVLPRPHELIGGALRRSDYVGVILTSELID